MKPKALLALTAILVGVFAPPAAANPYVGMDDEHVQFFTSPSGNIQCSIQFQRSAPAAAGGGFLPDWAHCMSIKPLQSVGIRADGSLAGVCKGDSCGSNGPTDQAVLPYGQSAALGPFTCQSEESGMTCTANDKGFTISTDGITVF